MGTVGIDSEHRIPVKFRLLMRSKNPRIGFFRIGSASTFIPGLLATFLLALALTTTPLLQSEGGPGTGNVAGETGSKTKQNESDERAKEGNEPEYNKATIPTGKIE